MNSQRTSCLAVIFGLLISATLAYWAWTGVDAANQSVDVSASIPIICSNNILELGEQCDGTALGGQTCVSRGFGGGSLGCTGQCSFDTSACTTATPSSGGGGGGSYLPPSASVSFSGRAYPLSRIVLLKDGQKAVSTISGPDASFSISLSNLSSGDYTFSIYGEDSGGDRSAPFTFSIFLTFGATTKVEGIFIAPTISIDKQEVRRGEDVAIFGQSVPYSNVTILVNSDNEFFKKTLADKNGAYLYNFDTSVLENGRHFTKSKSSLDVHVSSFSDSLTFLVGDKNVKAEENRAPAKGDLNGDKKVDISDFSVEAYWFGRLSPPPEIDLNGDGGVDLTDFSIMAYYWTG